MRSSAEADCGQLEQHLHDQGQLPECVERATAEHADAGDGAETSPMDEERELLHAVERAELASAGTRLAQALDRLAQFYRRRQWHTEAAAAYRRAVGLWRDILGPKHPSVATLLVNLGQIYVRLARLDEAEPIFRQALGIFEANKEVDNVSAMEVLEAFAHRLRASGREVEADGLEVRVRRVLSRVRVSVRA
jgi:tetratricopeptide (TPR) repeat protein